MSVFRLYFSYNYHPNMVAEFLNVDSIDTSVFLESKVVEMTKLDFTFNTLSKSLINQHIICCNLDGFIVSSNAKRKFENFLCNGTVQYIPVSLFFKNEIIKDYYFINTLKVGKIIDISNSNKMYFNDKDFILEDPIKTFPNSLDIIHIGRHNVVPYNTEIFFSESFVRFIEDSEINKNIVFQ